RKPWRDALFTPHQLLQCVVIRFAAGGDDHFADINVPVAVDPKVVRREEAAGRRRVLPFVAPAGQDLAGTIEDREPWPRRIRRRYLPWKTTALPADIDDEDIVLLVDENLHGPLGVGPLLQEVPLQVEDLNPAILAVGHIHQTFAVHGNP